MSKDVWKARPVFLTSTFRDMHAERDHLRDFVFPAIDERLRERREYLEPIDLRQGVETLGEEEAQQRELLVLKVCLEEVSRSRPFLIGLLGDRYGWIPPQARMQAAAAEAGFEGDISGRSVTELEIAFGVLADPEQRSRSLFYFRESLPYESMPSERAAEFSEDHNTAEDAPRAKRQLNALKAKLKESLPTQCRTYEVHWDPDSSRVVNLEAWGEQVFTDLWRELDAETQDAARDGPTTWQDAERWVLEQFIVERARGFVGREALLDSLIRFTTEAPKRGATSTICLTGDAGTGKSALFAALERRLIVTAEHPEQDVLVLAHAAGISPQSSRVDNLLRRWIDDLCRHLDVASPLIEPATTQDIERVFRDLIAQASVETRVVLLIDALNQFENTARAQNLTWLPAEWPPNVRVVATTMPGLASETLLARDGVELQSIPALSEGDAGAIIQSIHARYHRTVNPDLQQALLEVRGTNQTLAGSNPLWLTIAVEALNLLDEDDFARAERDYTAIPDPGQRLRQLALDTVARMPGDVAGMYAWLLERAETLHGREFVAPLISLIAVGRSGWREQDLESVTPVFYNEEWDELRFAALRRTLRSHLVQRGTQAQWDFSHVQLRAAARDRFVEDAGQEESLHLALADHLESLPKDDPLRESESMVHLIHSKQALRAAEFYATNVSGDAVRTVADYIKESSAEGDQIDWISSLHLLEGLDDYKRELIGRKTINELLSSIMNNVPMSACAVLLENARLIFDEMLARDPGDTDAKRTINRAIRPGWLLNVRTSIMVLRAIYLSLGDEERAMALLREAESLRRDTVHEIDNEYLTGERFLLQRVTGGQVSAADVSAAIEINQRTFGEQDGLYVDYLKKSEQRDQLGMIEVAKARVELAERVSAEAPESPGRLSGLIDTHRDLGRIYVAAKNYSLALIEYEIALAQARQQHELVQQQLLVEQNSTVASLETGESVPDNEIVADGGAIVVKRDDTINTGVGNIAFLRLVGAVAHLPTNTDRNVAVALIDLGNLHLEQADAARAREHFREARDIAELSYERAPDDTEVKGIVHRADVGLADCEYLDGRYVDAKRHYRKATLNLEQRAVRDPDNVTVARELAVLYRQIGLAHAALAERKDALHAYEQVHGQLAKLLDGRSADRDWAIDELDHLFYRIAEVHKSAGASTEQLEALSGGMRFTLDLGSRYPDEPKHKLNCARWCSRIGAVYALRGDWRKAAQAYGEHIQQIDAIESKSRTDETQVSRANALIEQAKAELAFGNEMVASGLIAESIEMTELLLKTGTGGLEAERSLTVALILQGTLLQSKEDYDATIDVLIRAAEISQHLVDEAPGEVRFQESLFSALSNHARCLHAKGDVEDSIELLESSLKSGRVVFESGRSGIDQKLALLAAYTSIAAIRSSRGDYDSAFSVYEAGVDVAESLVEEEQIDAQYLTHVFVTLENVGMVNQTRGNHLEAARSYGLAVQVAERATSLMPVEPYWPRAHCTVSTRLSEVLLAGGGVADAISTLQKITAMAATQSELNPADEYWRRSESSLSYRLALALENSGDPSSAQQWQRAADLLSALPEAGFELSEQDRQFLAVSLERGLSR